MVTNSVPASSSTAPTTASELNIHRPRRPRDWRRPFLCFSGRWTASFFPALSLDRDVEALGVLMVLTSS